MPDYMHLIGTTAIIATCTLVSLLAFRDATLMDKLLFRPYRVWKEKKFDTLYLSGFVHANFQHLFMNMITMYFFGYSLEKYMGTGATVVLFLLAVVIANVPALLRHRDNPEFASLGASGGTSGILLAYIIYFPQNRIVMLGIPAGIPAMYYAVFYIGYSWFQSHRKTRIHHEAHLWGALVGLAFAVIREPQAWKSFLASF